MTYTNHFNVLGKYKVALTPMDKKLFPEKIKKKLLATKIFGVYYCNGPSAGFDRRTIFSSYVSAPGFAAVSGSRKPLVKVGGEAVHRHVKPT